MINSIYTHKEIFLRELISNASDAIDKLYYKSLVEKKTGIKRSDFEIRLEPNTDERTLTISDNGIGMSKDELEKNLGTIAKSGSMDFKEGMEDAKKKKDVDIIGQFGVGFYSAFMVADDIKVYSKAFGESEGYLWESKGSGGYTITAEGGELPAESSGTKIVIKIKENAGEENYDAYLDWRQLKSLVKKYSDYIRFPIKMNVEKTKMLDEKDETGKAKTETYFEDEILNSQIPIWKRAKKDVSEEDYNNYYKEKFFDFENPLKVITTSVEGVVSYSALLYLPARPPFDYYTKEYEKGLALYSSGVMIMEKCAELVPDYFSFVKGVVDSDDLSLNISRELLQHDRQLLAIAQRLEKKSIRS
jgi:molecular chaperone HtpG